MKKVAVIISIIIILIFSTVIFMLYKEISALNARIDKLEHNCQNYTVTNEKNFENIDIDKKYDEVEQTNKELEKKQDELLAKVEELEYDLSLDKEEYYKKMAEENGYLDPDAMHYTNDYSN